MLLRSTPCNSLHVLVTVFMFEIRHNLRDFNDNWQLCVRGSNPVWGEIFRTCPDRPWGPPSLLYNGYRVFPGVKSGRGVTLTLTPF